MPGGGIRVGKGGVPGDQGGVKCSLESCWSCVIWTGLAPLLRGFSTWEDQFSEPRGHLPSADMEGAFLMSSVHEQN